MHNQVLSIEQMQELEKLGIDTNRGSMYWHNYNTEDDPRYELCSSADIGDTTTFTLQDILEMLPHTLEFKNIYGKLHFEYIEFWGDGWNQMAVVDPDHPSSPRITTSNISPLRAAFDMLKWCKQNNYI